ncbi:conserved hypothetical protein [Lactobacillus acetotolerans]|uniref:DegV family protein n=1 Tax=Lactobacillus acetotolerans TaxID=1600 RepID=A0A0D6A386_9LACO|nr:DegV family protein [Lactobacillus acetotolerans]BAQ57277.1 conserved hypothetical protein [Lactobacillus acetotolerans]
MKIGILTDSSAYLTTEQCKKYDIGVIPIPIVWDGKTYRDLIDISYKDFYKKLANATVLPTTSEPSVGEFKKYVNQYIKNNYTDLIVITLSSGLSGFYNTVVNTAKEEKRINIHPFDCRITCAGQADAVLLAGRLIQSSANVDLIMHDLVDLRNTMDVRFMVDNLNYLKRTGRLSNAASFVGSLFKIKPILSIDVQKTGHISAIAKERQYKRAYIHVQADFKRLTQNMPYPIQSTIFDALDLKRRDEWLEDYERKFPADKFYTSIIGPVVGVHVGQHTIAMIWCRNINSYFNKDGNPIENINSKTVND